MNQGQIPDGPACPVCRRTLDGYAEAGGAEPSRPPGEGDSTICVYCGSWLIFVTPTELRRASLSEALLIAVTPEGARAAATAAAIRRDRARLN